MMLFHKKKEKKSFDREHCRPVLMCSICNGEQVAGFKDLETGKFEEVKYIRDEKDLEEFMELYGIKPEEIVKAY